MCALPLFPWCLGGMEPVGSVQGPQRSGRRLLLFMCFLLHLHLLPCTPAPCASWCTPAACASWYTPALCVSCRGSSADVFSINRNVPSGLSQPTTRRVYTLSLLGASGVRSSQVMLPGQWETSPSPWRPPCLQKVLLWCSARPHPCVPSLCGALASDACLPGSGVVTWVQSGHLGQLHAPHSGSVVQKQQWVPSCLLHCMRVSCFPR